MRLQDNKELLKAQKEKGRQESIGALYKTLLVTEKIMYRKGLNISIKRK